MEDEEGAGGWNNTKAGMGSGKLLERVFAISARTDD
jgi:hypothetical protein